VSAGRNPPSVLTIFRFAAYLNLVQEHRFVLALLRAGQIFIPSLETSGSTIIVHSRWDFFLFCCQPSLTIHLQITHPVWREEFPLP